MTQKYWTIREWIADDPAESGCWSILFNTKEEAADTWLEQELLEAKEDYEVHKSIDAEEYALYQKEANEVHTALYQDGAWEDEGRIVELLRFSHYPEE